MKIENTIEKVINSIKVVKGIEAIVLGGSRARGNFNLKSDIDIGIYYSDSSQLDLEELNGIATKLDDTHLPNLIAAIGEWGLWINGGGWIMIDDTPTDFLLRDLQKVSVVIDDCLNGKISIDYQPGHPHGFINAIYAAETFYCNVLYDPKNIMTNLKNRIIPYPISLKRGIVNKFLWEVSFSLAIASKSVLRKDVVYASGCFYRAAACLAQVLYALNETYIMNEKGALDIIDTFKIMPYSFKMRIENIFNILTSEPENIMDLINQFTDIVREVDELCKIHI